MSINLDSRILLVEDIPTMRKIIITMLEQVGFNNIEQASDGELAWKRIEETFRYKREYDLVLSDWNMPQMSGLELLKKIRGDERFEKIPFLMVTGQDDQDKIKEAVEAGVTDFIVKPFTQVVLEKKIAKILEKQEGPKDKK